jgi:hypothetical protein
MDVGRRFQEPSANQVRRSPKNRMSPALSPSRIIGKTVSVACKNQVT